MNGRSAAGFVLAFLLLASLGEGGASPGAVLGLHLAVLLAVAVAIASGARLRLPAAGPGAAFAAFAVVAVVSAVRAPYAYAAILQLQEVAVFGVVLLLAATAGPDLPRRLATPLLAGAALQGGAAIVARFAFDAARPAGTFLNPNHLAAWIVAALWLALGVPNRSAQERAARLALAVPAVGGLVVTASRGALLAFFAAGVVWLWIAWGGMGRRARAAVAAGAAVALLAGALVVGSRVRNADAYAFHRVYLWQASLDVAATRPWLGVGPGQFPTASRAHLFDDGEGPMRFDRRFSNTHSDWIRPFAETGVVGGLAVLAFALAAAVGLSRRIRAEGRGSPAVGAAAALAALAVQAGVDNLSERPALFALAAALVGSALPGATTVRVARPWVRGVALVLILGAAILGEVAPWRAWRASLPAARLPPAARTAPLERAVSLHPTQPFHHARLADAWMSGARPDPDRYARARRAAEAAVRLQPADSEILRSLARVEATACLALFGDAGTRDRALEAYARAAGLAPFDATLALEVGDFRLRVGDVAGAGREVDRALGLEPASVAVRLLRAEVRVAAGDLEGAARDLAATLDAAAGHRGRTWDNAYTSTLMRLDRSRVERVRRALAAFSATG